MSITEKAMLAGVKISMWSARKLDRKVTDETNAAHGAQADAGRYNKALLSKDALAEIVTISNRARAEHYARTLPWKDNGQRILASIAYDDFARVFRDLDTEFNAAVDKFVSGYPAFVDDARVRLNGMFKADDYPDAAEVRARFQFKASIDVLAEGKDFRVDLSEGESERIRADIQAKFDAAMQMAMRDVFTRIADVVGAMSERLRAYQPGAKDGVFRDTLVGNVRDLVALLPSLNVTGDDTLRRIGNRMENLLCQHEPAALRQDATARRDTAAAADEILNDIAAFIA